MQMTADARTIERKTRRDGATKVSMRTLLEQFEEELELETKACFLDAFTKVCLDIACLVFMKRWDLVIQKETGGG